MAITRAAAGFQERARQPARAGADLDHRLPAQIAGGADDAPREVEIEQEMLAQTSPGADAVAGDDLAERRQGFSQRPSRRPVRARVSAIRAASLSAAIRLSGRAVPVPAMS